MLFSADELLAAMANGSIKIIGEKNPGFRSFLYF
jgi:hypothetical protein